MRKIFLLVLIVLTTQLLFAQKNKQTIVPKWITMMDDTAVNYYEAVNEFDNYWKDREKPVGEHELFSASNNEKQDKHFIYSKKGKKRDKNKYAFEYKKFKNWQERMLPFVKEDGSIMNGDERLKQWNQQRQQRK